MAHVQTQKGFLCLPAQSQEHRGDTRRPDVTRGELDRVIEGHHPAAGPVCTPWLEEEQEDHCQGSINDLQQTTGGPFSLRMRAGSH